MENRAIGSRYHVNATQAWKVDPAGKVSHIYV